MPRHKSNFASLKDVAAVPYRCGSDLSLREVADNVDTRPLAANNSLWLRFAYLWPFVETDHAKVLVSWVGVKSFFSVCVSLFVGVALRAIR